jgi:hypothetical protein
MGMPGTAAFTQRLSGEFWKFWTGQTISNLGTSFTHFALPLLVFKLTGSATHDVVLVYVACGVLRFAIPLAFTFSPLGHAEKYLPGKHPHLREHPQLRWSARSSCGRAVSLAPEGELIKPRGSRVSGAVRRPLADSGVGCGLACARTLRRG